MQLTLFSLQPNEATRTTTESQRVISKTGQQLIQNKKSAILAEKASAREITEKDILSLLSLCPRRSLC